VRQEGTGERLDAFMARANAAYYATHDPFADFTTAPEISQAFGEVLGLWAAVTWSLLGRPSPVLLIEAGPGRGTLMGDALRAIQQAVPDFRAALQVHLIESSARLRDAQRLRVPDAMWHERLGTVPEAPFVLLANEFVDALPIRQFVRRADRWMERWVVRGQFEERPAEPGEPMDVDWGRHGAPLPPAADGDVAERCEPALAFAREVSERMARVPGAALLLDYGPAESTAGDSLQALSGGKPADALSRPGTADLTAHVDFASVAAVARHVGVSVHGPVPQGLFLARLGLAQRAHRLASGLPATEALAMMQGVRRLMEPNRMGRLFKALALTPRWCREPPGFEG